MIGPDGRELVVALSHADGTVDEFPAEYLFEPGWLDLLVEYAVASAHRRWQAAS